MDTTPADIAVIGMACRFPGANDPDQYWRNLREGVESIRFQSDEVLLANGVTQRQLDNPRYVKASAPVEGGDTFDAAFFGYSAREAELMDPQHRLFLETGYSALEDAGYDPARYDGLIGVYAGSTMNTYILMNLVPNQSVLEVVGDLQTMIGNDKEYLASRVSYKLNLKGPSCVVQTACSTSLVAVHMACQAILAGECDMALVGGSSVRMPLGGGYMHQPGGTSSSDGHCRAFDAAAEGSVVGSGVGAVVLKHLKDAIRDGDHVYTVIKGTAINNDGNAKVSFTAPSVEGQARAAASALLAAGLTGDDIDYIEAHGTGTPLGDPIEVAALTRGLRETTDRRQDVVLGSVKTNIGHLDAAAGVAGFIKAVQSVRHGLVPPTLNFTTPNPQIDFAASPFYVSSELVDWPEVDRPRRAAVNSIGMGGTNAHVVIEQAPPPAPASGSAAWQLLRVSAATPTALDTATARLATWLREHPAAELADVAYTLDVGRRPLSYRRTVVARDVEDAAAALGAPGSARVTDSLLSREPSGVVFLFPGQGSQRFGMGATAYAGSPVFREVVDDLLDTAPELLAAELRELVLTAGTGTEAQERRLADTRVTQPALFLVCYGWARALIAYGISPTALLGHSIGELVAAAVAGVLRPADAFALVIARGELMAVQPAGAMLSVVASAETVREHLGDDVDIAAINGPALVSVSGTTEAVDVLAVRLDAAGIASRRLIVSHPFHSRHMQAATDRLRELAAAFPATAPEIPMLSNVTGDWHGPAPIEPAYWGEHVRRPVDVAGCLERLNERQGQILLEVGPGETMLALARQYAATADWAAGVPTLPMGDDKRAGRRTALEALAGLWHAGLMVSEPAAEEQPRHRLALPTYPFERKRYWIQPVGNPTTSSAVRDRAAVLPDPHQWIHQARWQELDSPTGSADRVVVAADTRTVAEETEILLVPAPDDLAAASILVRDAAAAVRDRKSPLRLVLAVRGAGRLLDRADVAPSTAALAALAHVASQETAMLDAGVVAADGGPEEIRTLVGRDDPPLVAIRGGRRWGRVWIPLPVSGQESLTGRRVAVLGGLGLFGRRAAAHLLAQPETEVWLLDNRAEKDLDAAESGDLARLRGIGGDRLTVARADVTDAASLAAALDPALDERLAVVIIAAGPLSLSPAAVSEIDGGTLAAHVTPRAAMVSALAEVLAVRPVTPRVVQVSSLSTALGGLGSAAYAAANELAATLAENQGPGWTSVDWEHWRRPDEVLAGSMARYAMDAELIGTTLEIVLAAGHGRLAVSTGDLGYRVEQSRPTSQAPARAETDGEVVDGGTHRRPDIQTPYMSPSGDVEKNVAAQMKRLLGIDRVGAADNFFDLGGDSLMAMQLISLLRDEYRIALPMEEIFADPTVRGLAVSIQKHGEAELAPPAEDEKGDEDEDLAALFAEIEQMNDNEVARQLSELSTEQEQQ
ncbi:Acyl transferase domain-containing protein [Streptosporangium canum]|uniref:Acyl transferase domain-containing protein n=1 Tax=Streptosporangium canum TaxID=324952 RepID=A0A1I3N0D4_9ACTN|nr:type I polyketide synthase [Streptosporangium canum]SFJ02652.1 Acyl transferase domain-containing protein [Streptosporangium canum]